MSGKPIERNFEANLIKRIKELLPESIIVKLDRKQGIPDRLILYKNKWASLEFKRASDASHRPNQDWYVDKMNTMSFSRFVYPENKNEVLDDLITFMKGRTQI